MTTKPPSGLAASGTAERSRSRADHEGTQRGRAGHQRRSVGRRHRRSDRGRDHRRRRRTRRPVAATRHRGVSPGQRAPTLLGVPIQSLPLPGVTSASENEDATRTIDYDDEITVLAQPSPRSDGGAGRARRPSFDDLDRPSITDDDGPGRGPSITDDDEEETKVEPAETAMKAAASIDDVTTALSAQASLEREKALRRSVPAPSPSDDLEFADPEADDDQDEDRREPRRRAERRGRGDQRGRRRGSKRKRTTSRTTRTTAPRRPRS